MWSEAVAVEGRVEGRGTVEHGEVSAGVAAWLQGCQLLVAATNRGARGGEDGEGLFSRGVTRSRQWLVGGNFPCACCGAGCGVA